MDIREDNALITEILIYQFVKEKRLLRRIKEERCISSLTYLLHLMHKRIQRHITAKHNFPVTKILYDKRSLKVKMKALYYALLIQADDVQFIRCLRLFNKGLSAMDLNKKWDDILSGNVLELVCLAAVIIEQNKENILQYVDKFKLKVFMLKMCDSELSDDIPIDKASLFFKYFDFISQQDSTFIDETVEYFVKQENFDFLCLTFDKKINVIVASDYFQKKELYDFLKCHIFSGNYTRKKQVHYILWRIIEHLKKDRCLVVPNSICSNRLTDWDNFFIIYEMSKEKQLHLIQPTLKLLDCLYIPFSWRLCLFQELLNHSQLTIVYSTVEHILKICFGFGMLNGKLIGDVLSALNKFEYSELTKESFTRLDKFCAKYDYLYIMFVEEFLKIDWNPAAAWCVLKSSFPMIPRLPGHLIIKQLTCLKKLPHLYIKHSCIIFFIEKLFNNSLKVYEKYMNSSLKVYEIVRLIGKFLFSTGQQLDEKVFHQIIEKNKSDLVECSENIKEDMHKNIGENNLQDLIISLELVKKLEIDFDIDLEFYNSSSDMLFLYFPNLLKSDFEMYLVQRFENDDDDYHYLLKYLEMSFDQGIVNISNDGCWKLWNLSENSKSKRFIASYSVYRMGENNESGDTILMEQAESYLRAYKYEMGKLWMKKMRKSFGRISNEQLDELHQKFLELLNDDDDKSLKLILDNLDLVTETASNENPEFVKVLDVCYSKLCSLPNNLRRTYSVVFFESIFELKVFSAPIFVQCWTKWFGELFKSNFMGCNSILKAILMGCRKVLLLEAPFANILTPFVLSALTQGIVIHKNERVEYGVCQEIHNTIGSELVQNPNIIASEMKMLAMECLYLLAKSKFEGSISTADTLMRMLLALYKKNYKKRYFPDSKIHLEKLRIIQAMLMIVHLVDKTKQEWIDFVYQSFCEESHQPSIKLLLQWMVIILASKPRKLRWFINKLHPEPWRPLSSMVALIPVTYHLLEYVEEEEDFWCGDVTEVLLSWSMGANFKLRMYAQRNEYRNLNFSNTIEKILMKAKDKQLTEYLDKHSFLEESLSGVTEAAGVALFEALGYDKVVIDHLDPYLHYCVENIFVVWPKMFDAPSHEWENVLEHKFSEGFDVKIKSEHKLPYIHICKKNANKIVNNTSGNLYVQKKISPWKQQLENRIADKTLNSLICVASLLEKSSNIGGLSRTCEIYNLKQLVLHNIKIKEDKDFKNLSMSSENWVDFLEVKRDDLSEFLTRLKQQGYVIVGLEQTSKSVDLHRFKFNKKTVILLGNEKEGIPAPLLYLLDICLEIPQFGQTRSLNVHVAGATCIWEYVKQHML